MRTLKLAPVRPGALMASGLFALAMAMAASAQGQTLTVTPGVTEPETAEPETAEPETKEPALLDVMEDYPPKEAPPAEDPPPEDPPPPPPPPPPPANSQQIHNSLVRLGGQRIGQMVNHSVLARHLLGGAEQINCGNCFSAFGAIGSFSAGINGRYNVTRRLSILGGLSMNQFRNGGVDTRNALIAAMSFRYDLTDWGKSRPYFEVGATASPFGSTRMRRTYAGIGGPFAGRGRGNSRTYQVFGTLGWVWRATARDEFAFSMSLSRIWTRHDGYRESATANNPLPAVYLPGTDSMNVVRGRIQHTHLFGSKIELLLSAGLAHSFATKSGVRAIIGGAAFAPTLGNYTWGEYVARVGYRMRKNMVLDTFVFGTLGKKPVGNSIHGGLGLRVYF